MLVDLDARLGCEHGEAAHPARGLERGVAGVEDRGAEAAVERILHPLRREAVLAQQLVLDVESVALLLVRGEPQAPGAAERITRE